MRAGSVFEKLLLGNLLLCSLLGSAQAQLDDPTRPPGYHLATPGGKKTSNQFRLSSVYISAQRKTATLNGRRVEVGDTVNGAKVEAILPGEVRLSQNQKIITVRLIPNSIKKQITSTTK